MEYIDQKPYSVFHIPYSKIYSGPIEGEAIFVFHSRIIPYDIIPYDIKYCIYMCGRRKEADGLMSPSA
jgi:hypothetical protein